MASADLQEPQQSSINSEFKNSDSPVNSDCFVEDEEEMQKPGEISNRDRWDKSKPNENSTKVHKDSSDSTGNCEQGIEGKPNDSDDSKKENAKDSPEKKPGTSAKRKTMNTIFNYFKRSSVKKQQKLEQLEAARQARTEEFQEMSDGSSGEENSRPWRLSPEPSKVSPDSSRLSLDSPRLSPDTSQLSRESSRFSRESPRHSPKTSRHSPEMSRPKTQLKDKRVRKIRRHRTPTTWVRFCVRDTKEYRAGYPNKIDSPIKKDNLRFYKNEIPSRPKGDYIDDLHKEWFGDYDKLEQHHGYIQWLFPIREDGMNREAQELQLHEAEAIKKDPEAHARVLTSYKLMLDFFGMRIKDETSGELERADNWEERFTNLRVMRHNHLRITRILKSLGELGYEHFKPPFMKMVLYEILQQRTLHTLLDSALDFWVFTLRDDDRRQEILDYASQFVENVNQ